MFGHLLNKNILYSLKNNKGNYFEFIYFFKKFLGRK